MVIRTRLFLDSEEYGFEFFDVTQADNLLAKFQRLVESCKKEYARDKIIRRVGVQIDIANSLGSAES